jgi:hypothetical protein
VMVRTLAVGDFRQEMPAARMNAAGIFLTLGAAGPGTAGPATAYLSSSSVSSS